MSDRKIVRKDEFLILARNTWSEVEGKLFASLIKELKPIVKPKVKDKQKPTDEELLLIEEFNNIEFPTLSVTIDDLEKLWQHKINTSQIDTICVDLKSKTYILPGVDEDGYKIKKYISLFEDITYHLDKRIITFKFDKAMKSHLLAFTTKFVTYKIDMILSFKSKYTMSLYEAFKLQTQFKRESMIIEIVEIQELRDWLNLNKNKLNKFKADKYIRTNDLKKYVLDKIVTDMKKYSDVYMDYELIKTYRKVTHIKFSFTKNLSKSNREKSFFDDDELENEYSEYLNKPFLYDGQILEIKVITPMDNFYVATYSNGQNGRIENLKSIEKLIKNYKG